MAESGREQPGIPCGFGAEQGKELVVNSAVATLWSEPGGNRPLDEMSTAAVVDIRSWTAGMTIQDKLWLVGKLETQALYGQRVKVIDTAGDWVKVIVSEQPTSRNEEGYPGWMPLRQLTDSEAAFIPKACPQAVVKAITAFLYDAPAADRPFLELSFNTRLPIVEEIGAYYVVQTPGDGEKYLPKTEAMLAGGNEATVNPTGEHLVDTANLFLGLPYLWAGVSAFGFDCSGFTYSLYGFHGIGIPRDASDQSKSGTAVRRSELRPGDLMFFAYDNGKGRVHHVGMYAGNGQMIHSPKSESSIELTPIDTPYFVKEYAGARRYLPDD
jgi:cell wall-associated NlpC family hydrolase